MNQKYSLIVPILFSFLVSGCSSLSSRSPQRDVASKSETCAEIRKQITDQKALETLGCSGNQGLSHVFSANARWTQERMAFNEIDVGGITMDAFQKAYRECSKKFTLCVIKSVDTTSVDIDAQNVRKAEFTVVVHGVDSFASNAVLKKFDGKSWTTNTRPTGQLSLLSAQYFAITDALTKCYQAGFALCAVGGYNLTESNNFRNGAYRTSAEATVIGVNFARPVKNSLEPQPTFKIQYGTPLPTFDLDSVGKGVEI